MLFTSPEFLFVFLPAVAGATALLRLRGPRGLIAPGLLAASMAFYAWWSPWFLGLLAASTLVNWGLARAIDAAGARRRGLLVLGLAWNLGLLAYFKYADFFIDATNRIAGTQWNLLHVVLPLGISFFTFQKIAYLVDVSRAQARPGRLIDFGLFVFFFPQLIAGPIVHHAEVMPQFGALTSAPPHARGPEREAVFADLAVGLTLLVMGLFKKVVVADSLAPYATVVFDLAEARGHPGMLQAWQGALAYAAQLYFDFSGYSDMAIGLARMLGVRLPANFDSPYAATSIVAFWRRWHMTLSRFLRDYLYVPLGGNRRGPARRRANLMATMLLGGLWHGAGATFVIWGGLHGAYLLANHAWRGAGRAMHPAAGWALTMLAVVVAWVWFRAPSVGAALDVLGGMAGLHGLSTPQLGMKRGTGVLVPLALLVAAAVLPNTQQVLRRFDPVLGPVREPPRLLAPLVWRPNGWTATALALALVAVLLSGWRTSEFLYFQF